MIICPQCNEPKSENDFYDRGDGSGKKKKRCKRCDNNAKHNYYLTNSDSVRRNAKRWYKANKTKRAAKAKEYNKTPKGRLVKLMQGAKNRAKKYHHIFALDSHFLLELWNNQSAKCALTNIPFEFENNTIHDTNPFAPSIDRINSTGGYTKDNVRLVCVAVNYALNEFGEETFKQICEAYLHNLSS